MSYLLYEEVKFAFNLDFTVQQEVLLAEMKDVYVRKADVKHTLKPVERALPLYDDLNMTEE